MDEEKVLQEFYKKLDDRNKAFLKQLAEREQAKRQALINSLDYCTRDRIAWRDFFRANSN